MKNITLAIMMAAIFSSCSSKKMDLSKKRTCQIPCFSFTSDSTEPAICSDEITFKKTIDILYCNRLEHAEMAIYILPSQDSTEPPHIRMIVKCSPKFIDFEGVPDGESAVINGTVSYERSSNDTPGISTEMEYNGKYAKITPRIMIPALKPGGNEKNTDIEAIIDKIHDWQKQITAYKKDHPSKT